MKRTALLLLTLLVLTAIQAEDGSRLWLHYHPQHPALVDGEACLAADVLRRYADGLQVTLQTDATLPDNDGYRIDAANGRATITAHSHQGLLYGAFALLRGETGASAPYYQLRLLNHWDNLDGTIERGYAGRSIFWETATLDTALITAYAEANASIGINGTVLNNVNASPQVLSRTYLHKVKAIADVLRPWGIRVYLSVNFASPMALGGLKTADPLNRQVQRWWTMKSNEIYQLIPDFGGFLVKANSEGQPGPFDYGRTHAQGANMLARALQPHGGVVIWRSFVYGAQHKGEDRVKQAVSEFAPLDGQFAPNVILQSKNGPLDFQPREPYAPIFDQMQHTPQMAELQITQEYLGQSRHLVFLAPMWKEFFSYVSPSRLRGIAGVANIGRDANWCGHHFSQANWYAFGRLAWDPSLSSRQIAEEWLRQTFSQLSTLNSPLLTLNNKLLTLNSQLSTLTSVLLRSREACVDYMMPLGLHHIFRFDHHLGPDPGGFKEEYPLEWCPVYYHHATADSIGFDRTHSGSDATSQYREPYCSLFDDVDRCPERFLLWFHRVPWTRRLNSGRTVMEELRHRYERGVSEVEDFCRIWQEMRPFIDEQRWQEVNERLEWQLDDAREWRDVCLRYFAEQAEK